MAQRNENKRAGKEYKPREHTRGPRPEWCGPRPYVWKSGPNLRDHEQYQAWLVHKAQANFRGEAHEMTFEDFREVWNQDGNWELRGRGSENICMYRIDVDQPWRKDNVAFEQRKTYLARVNGMKKGTKYKQGKR